MSQLSAYSSSGFLFTYVHNICRSTEPTYFEIHVLIHCFNLQCFYCPLTFSISYTWIRFVPFSEHLWTMFHFASCEVQGWGISGLFQWVEGLLILDVSEERTSFIFDCARILESMKMEDSEYGSSLQIVYYYLEGRLSIQLFNNLFHVRLPDLRKIETCWGVSGLLCKSAYFNICAVVGIIY